MNQATELVHLEYAATGYATSAPEVGATVSVLTGTPNHPFWSVTRSGSVGMGDLLPGESLLLSDRRIAVVVRLRTETLADTNSETARRNGFFVTYNFEVQGFHTYFVAPQGETHASSAILVHNQCLVMQTLKQMGFKDEDVAEYLANGLKFTKKQAGEFGELYAKNLSASRGYTDIIMLQNKSGHGIDLIARHKSGKLLFIEVKGNKSKVSKQQRNLPEYVRDRLARIQRGEEHWSTRNAPRMQQIAESLIEELEKGTLRARLVRVKGIGKGMPNVRITVPHLR